MVKRPKVIPFRRGARRHRTWDLGTPPRHTRKPQRPSLRDPRGYLRLVIVLAGLALIALPFGSAALTTVFAPKERDGCRVLSVTDGDTIRMYCPGRGMEKARLIGFDTPEIFSPRCASELYRGLRAKWALRAMLWQADRISIVRQGEDRYGRALVFVALDDVPVARRMIDADHARAYAGGQRAGWCEAKDM
ncbi:thermonuclease family protein [Roseovarius aestuariivivens]|uniref:thermonuclease family protein n=1 Tax=Roseovarius aestuariivivens TaxID=1888910 RepID=UPI00108176E7|nr:thermonuclease family protein [Roseovarius aestuariivivens]